MRTHAQVTPAASAAHAVSPRQRPARDAEPSGDLAGQSSAAARFGHRLAGISAEAPGGPLRVGPSDDRYEREADRVAERIVAETQTPGAGTAESVNVTPLATPPTAAGFVQRVSYQSDAGGTVAPEVATQIHAAKRQGGQPLPPLLRRPAEQVLRADLSRVRLHQDADSQRLADAVGAPAFATGHHIFLGSVAQELSSASGRGIIAHELTHTVQQHGDAAGPNGGVIQRFDWRKSLWKHFPRMASAFKVRNPNRRMRRLYLGAGTYPQLSEGEEDVPVDRDVQMTKMAAVSARGNKETLYSTGASDCSIQVASNGNETWLEHRTATDPRTPVPLHNTTTQYETPGCLHEMGASGAAVTPRGQVYLENPVGYRDREKPRALQMLDKPMQDAGQTRPGFEEFNWHQRDLALQRVHGQIKGGGVPFHVVRPGSREQNALTSLENRKKGCTVSENNPKESPYADLSELWKKMEETKE